MVKTAPKTKTINLRDIPEDLHRHIKVCAAQTGLSIKDWILQVVTGQMQAPKVSGSTLQIVEAPKKEGKR